MAVYKVPQDVEADDKLIGPFSFRQFIYLIIVALAIGLAWALGQIFIALALIPLPIIVLFGALALPLRKDQPMEIYLAAIVSFFLKPHKRMWQPDGTDWIVEIAAPKMIEQQLTKDLSQEEAQRRLAYLAEIVDTQGWAVRGLGATAALNTPMTSDNYYAAQQVQDMLDNDSSTSQLFEQKLNLSNQQHRLDAISLAQGKQPFQKLEYNPYPEEMQQAVVQPIEEINQLETLDTSKNTVSADIIDLANNTDLSIETIAREANRIHQRHDLTDEVFVSLR